MKVCQAVFVSDSTKRDGSQYLLSRSRGIDGRLVEQLIPWIPACNEMVDDQSESINFFRPAMNKLALSRSVNARPASRQIEGSRLVTTTIVLELNQLSGFENNAALFANVVRSMGHLYLQPCVGPELPALDVPDHSIRKAADCLGNNNPSQAESISRAVNIHKQVAIFGQIDPIAWLCSFLSFLPIEQRWQTSFSTGLKVDNQRPFHLHFFRDESPWLLKELVQAQIRTISLESKQVA